MTENNKRVFESLAAKHMDEIYTKAIRLTRSAEKAEIWVQQTYATAFGMFKQFDMSKDFLEWLIALLLVGFTDPQNFVDEVAQTR